MSSHVFYSLKKSIPALVSLVNNAALKQSYFFIFTDVLGQIIESCDFLDSIGKNKWIINDLNYKKINANA